ncbi:hypothetical protein FB451DRAFT_1387071 [Mycena latifolia]|nr:hypothetical protein FB451DRAFT_1387071 [Mycena latifolia]
MARPFYREEMPRPSNAVSGRLKVLGMTAGVVFDLNHPGDGLVRRELTPPSPFTPRPRNPRPEPQGEKRKRRYSKAGPAVGGVVIDLAMVEDGEDVQMVEALLGEG